jgi:hypothetical protein
MKKSLKVELSLIAQVTRVATMRQWLLHVHNFSMTDLQMSDMLAMIDGFNDQIHPKPKCLACEQRAEIEFFATHAQL